ncbi:sterol desaturase family protein [Virgifigura deserti]|uniref:sterol desaturase family protein n=1 Tax=Virgifigura deserti TaxID=2268457 RepID=UPI003CCBAB1A
MMASVEFLLAYKGLVVGACLLLLFAGERLLPAAPPPEPGPGEPPGGFRRLARNGGLWLINLGLSPLIVVPVSAWAAANSLGFRPDWWSGWPGLVLDVVLLDLLIYWWHRFNHELPFLWRFHQVHHLDRFLDSSSALRFHFGEVLLSAVARAAVIVVLGIPLLSVLVFETLLLCATIFHHSNLRLAPGLECRLAKVVITPSIHWVHHHAIRSDTDSNYGTLFSVWDPLFRSRSATARRPDMKIGVEGRAERSLPQLLLQPFRRRSLRPLTAN